MSKERLQDIFTLEEYNKCVEQIKNGIPFKAHFSHGLLMFNIGCEHIESDCWANNRYGYFSGLYKSGGFSYPFNCDQIPSYEEICDITNRVIERNS